MCFFGNNKHTPASNPDSSYTINQLKPTSQQSSAAPNAAPLSVKMSVKVLGSGCVKCRALEAATSEAIAALGLNAHLEHITDFSQIAAYGVMSTPALVINEQVVATGRVLKQDEIIALLQAHQG